MYLSKILTLLIIFGLLSGFTFFEIYRKSDKAVLNIITPTIIEVDLNGNKIYDTGETICIPNIEAFTSDLNRLQPELAKNLNISLQDSIKFGYLTDNFTDSLLASKRVKVKFTGEQNQNCKFADIYIDTKSYREELLKSGFGIVEGKTNDKFNKHLTNARKLKLSILNHKSNKYHTLDCKYGLIAHDAIIIREKELPNNSHPCKFCHVKASTKSNNKNSITTYPLVISNGSIKMFLTDLTTKLKPDGNCTSLVCQEILTQINSSKTSIDIALYGWDNNSAIYNALLKAKARGVKIQMVYDTSKKSYYPELLNFIKIADKTSTDTPKILMHNKFIIFDNAKVLTGSMNFAKTGFSGFNTNCVFLINSHEIAKIFQEEFNQMLEGKFHHEKSKVNHKTVLLNSSKITPLFSPKDKVITSNIVPLINNAKKYIFIPTFILTHDEMATALINAKKRGIDVKIIIDATNPTASRSKIKLLRESCILVKTENYAGKVHSKSIIIDDKYVIAGSMNFTNSGENKNDENCLIIEDERLARYYKGFFEYLWAKIPDKYLKINPRPEGKSSIGSCSDGVDNNYNGKIDLDEEACKP